MRIFVWVDGGHVEVGGVLQSSGGWERVDGGEAGLGEAVVVGMEAIWNVVDAFFCEHVEWLCGLEMGLRGGLGSKSC